MTTGHEGPGGRLFVVINAGSGHKDTEQARALIAAIFTEARRPHEFLLVEDAAQLQATAGEAVRRAQEQGGAVVAAGGDGTINGVAQAVLGSGVAFGVLPMGTFNYFGRAHGIPQDTEAAARALLRAEVQAIQVGMVNDQIFLVNASLGLYPKLLEDRELFKQQFGRSRLVAMVSGIRSLLRERRQLNLSIEFEGRTGALRTPTLFIGNNALQLQRLGFDEADRVEQGRLVGVAVRPISNLQMLGLILRGALGRLGEAEHVTSLAFRKLTVHAQSQRLIKVGADGEIRRLHSPLVFSVAPQSLALLAPRAEDRVTRE